MKYKIFFILIFFTITSQAALPTAGRIRSGGSQHSTPVSLPGQSNFYFALRTGYTQWNTTLLSPAPTLYENNIGVTLGYNFVDSLYLLVSEDHSWVQQKSDTIGTSTLPSVDSHSGTRPNQFGAGLGYRIDDFFLSVIYKFTPKYYLNNKTTAQEVVLYTGEHNYKATLSYEVFYPISLGIFFEGARWTRRELSGAGNDLNPSMDMNNWGAELIFGF